MATRIIDGSNSEIVAHVPVAMLLGLCLIAIIGGIGESPTIFQAVLAGTVIATWLVTGLRRGIFVLTMLWCLWGAGMNWHFGATRNGWLTLVVAIPALIGIAMWFWVNRSKIRANLLDGDLS